MFKKIQNTTYKILHTQKLTVGFVGLVVVGVLFSVFASQSVTAAPWATVMDGFLKRKQLTLINTTGQQLEANTTYTITVDTKALYDAGDLQSGCQDVRVVYQPNSTTAKQLSHYFDTASGTTCATSTATTIYFPLQANMSNGSSTTYYYLYYKNTAAQDASSVSAFNVGEKTALLHCGFNGDTTCINGDGAESPTTESGAIRYSGSKSAMSFDGIDDYIDVGSYSNYTGSFLAVESWVYLNQLPATYDYIAIGRNFGSDFFELRLHSGGQLYFGVWNSSGSSVSTTTSGTVSAGSWVHVAGVYDGTNVKAYINGTTSGTPGSLSGNAGYGSGTVYIGGGGQAAPYTHNGLLDEVRISSIARYTSNFTPSTSPFIPDEYTKLLLHFDENGDDPRNTGKAIDASGNGNHGTITGAKYVSGLVGVDGTLNQVQGDLLEGVIPNSVSGSHSGIFIEEGTTNKITNPSFDHGTYDTGWTVAGGNLTATSNTTAPYYKFGSKSEKLVASASAISSSSNMRTISINVGNTNTHTLSAYVYDSTSGNVGGTVSATVAKLVFGGSTSLTTTYVDVGGGWWRLSYSAAGINGAAEYGVEVQPSKTVYVDGVQLEEKAYATTYADGSLGTGLPAVAGYSWSGTAHESTSARTVSSMKYLVSSNIQASSGSFSLWLKPDWAGNDNVEHVILDTDTSAGSLKLFKNTSNNLVLTDGTNSATKAVSWTTGQWQNIVGTWTSGTLQVYANSNAGTSASFSVPIFSTSMYVAQDKTNSSLGNFAMGDLRTYSSALSSTEVADLYYSGLGTYQEQVQSSERFTGSGEPPVLNWKMVEGYGTSAYDSTIFQNNGTLSGAVWDTTIASPVSSSGSTGGSSLSFDGSNDYVSKTYTNDTELNPNTNDFTVGAWFRSPSTSSGQTRYLVSRYNSSGYKMYMNSSGYICFGIDDDSTWGPDDSACTTTSYADSTWHYAQASVILSASEGSTPGVYLYIDGILGASDASLLATGSLSGSNATFYVGIDSDGVSSPWAGHIAGIRLYRSQRNATAVKNDYQSKGNLSNVSEELGGNNPGGGGVAASDLSEGLVGYWPMEEVSTGAGQVDRTDSSGNSNTLTDTNTIASSGGKFGNGGDFENTDSEHLTIADGSHNGLEPSSAITVSAWIKPESFAGLNIILAKYNTTGNQRGYRLNTLSNGSIQFVLSTDGVAFSYAATGAAAVTLNNWYHVVAIYDGAQAKIYVNGTFTEVASTNPLAFTGSLYNGSAAFMIGKQDGLIGYTFDGQMDEVRVYNRAFSAEEVRALYNFAPGPRVHLKMDEGSGSAAQDSSGNSRTGTLNNNATWGVGRFGKGIILDGTDDSVSISDF